MSSNRRESSSASKNVGDGVVNRKGGYRVRRNEKGESELHRACINGDYNTVERLLLKGHPVNEKDFGGWTPLHEACNWGFSQIVRLLIEYGANVEAKGMGNVTPLLDASANGQLDIVGLLLNSGASIAGTDSEGNTILDLLEVHKRNSDGLSESDEAEYRRLSKLVEERMRKEGIPLRRTNHGQNSRSDTNATNRNGSQNRSSNNDGPPGRAGVSTYMSAMSSIGRSAAKKTGAVFNYDSFNAKRSSRRRGATGSSSAASTSKSALVSEQEYEVSDDWMIDDLNGHYIRHDPCDTKKRSRVRMSDDSSPTAVSDDDDGDRSMGNSNSPVRVNVDDCYDSELPSAATSSSKELPRPRAAVRPRGGGSDSEHDDGLLLLSERRTTRSPKRRRLHQTRLDTFPISPPSASEDIEEIVVHSIATVQPIVAEPGAPPTNHRPGAEFVRVNVMVEGRKFAVIIDNRLHTIEWLADKVSANYESATGKRPLIRLYTSDDAALSASDTVEFLFYQNEQLVGKVERVDILPLEDHYRQICQRQKQEPCGDICDVLRGSAQSTMLDLRMSCLRIAGGAGILLKAMQSEYNLTTLNLRGQKLSTFDATELGRAMVNLPFLASLVLSCTGIHCEQVLALATEITRDRDKRLVLEKLDVSFNSLGDSSASHLSRILVRCPQLRLLNLQCISATARFVQDHKASWRDAFSATALTYVNVSRNRLGDGASDLQSMLNDLDRYVELKSY